MKVVLRDDVAGVGRRGDIVKVAGGFARNFLLPEGRAIVATEGVEGQAEQMRRGRDLREAQDRGAAEAQATVLAGAVIPIAARASGGGRLFGSIGPADVVEAIKAAKGIEVDRRHILLPEHIKETGSFEVTVELFRDVATVVTVEVSASLLTRAASAAAVTPRAHDGGVPICVLRGPQSLTTRARLIHTHGVPYPHLLGPYRSPARDRQSR